MSDGKKGPTSIEFSVFILITFLLSIDILELAMLIQLYGDDDQVKFLQVLQLSNSFDDDDDDDKLFLWYG